MNISIVIPTLRRSIDLKVLFDSLLTQTKAPLEIIIVDQSDNNDTEKLCESYRERLPIRYLHSLIKSASYCRNLGVEKSEGEIIAFLDDDTKLETDYLESIELFYKEYPQAQGGMSRIINYREFREKLLGRGILNYLYKIIASLFCLNSFKKGFIVLKSSRNIDYYEAENTINVQWMSTCNCWLKKDIFKEFRFEERFQKWSYGEDRMWSYKIQKKYPGSLFFYPKAALYHFESSRNRMNVEEKIQMMVVYQFWFFLNCLEEKKFFYWWANAGEIGLHLINAAIGRESFMNSWYYLRANIKLLLHMKKVKSGNLNLV